MLLWAEHHWQDFGLDSILNQELEHFIERLQEEKTFTSEVKRLRTTIKIQVIILVNILTLVCRIHSNYVSTNVSR